ALASLLSGLALANSRLGVVHGLAAPVGGLIAAPHGAVCARLLPICWKANVKALARDDHPGLERYREVARLLTGQNTATLDDGSAKIQELSDLVQAPGFAHWGLAEQDIPGLCEKAAKASSMKGNPIDLTHQELSEILLEAL
ncbi:MAG: iron-containing alcohol dehydrogenase, partial [Fibrobacterota bacterium]